jgi:HK97 family phage portal protein
VSEPATKPAAEQRSVTTQTIDAADFLLKKYGLDGIRAHVNAKNAMGISTFFGCVKLISNVLASLPLNVYQYEEGKGSRKDRKHSLDWILATRTNKNMGPFVARRTLIANCLVHGWAFASIEKNGLGQIKSITPYPSNEVDILYDDVTDSYFFSVGKIKKVFSQDEGIFLKDLSLDGSVGHSIVNWQKQVIKIDLLVKAFTEKYYEKSTFMGGIIEAAVGGAAKDEEAAKLYKKRLIESFQDDDNGGFGVAVLGMGSKFHKIGMSPVESQLLEMCDKGSKEVAMAFNIPLFMLGDTEKQTSFGSGVEQMFIAVTNTVFIPIAVQVEQEIDYKCFRRDEIMDGYFIKHNFKGLLRGDMKAQAEHAAKMVSNGIYMPDEARDHDEMAPLPKGTGARGYMNGTMTPMELIDQVKTPKNNGKKDSSAGAE